MLAVQSFMTEVTWFNITDPYMKESSILVISVIIKLQDRIIFRLIFSLNMKESSILISNQGGQDPKYQMIAILLSVRNVELSLQREVIMIID